LFNWLYARHTGGKFLLRIEDTDRQRSTKEAIQIIIDGLAWLGIDYDEEIVYQSTRVDRHRKAARKLLENGKAYRCFCDPQVLAKEREEAFKKGQPYPKDRICPNLSEDEVQSNLRKGKSYAVKLKVPAEEVRYIDGVHGEIIVSGVEIEDFVLLRSNGTPTYMIAVVVDDVDMGITHVIRGDDHISNTPKQILLYRALGYEEPLFSHVPLILGKDKKRLSKRHGATSITAYREKGYLPETIINYLGLLGWSPGDDRDEINRQELIDLFDTTGVNSRSAVFDEAKLLWLNGKYISQLAYEDVTSELRIYAKEAISSGIINNTPDECDVKTAWQLLNNRIHTLPDLFEWGVYFFQDPTTYEPKGVRKHFRIDGAADRLESLADGFDEVNPFNKENLETLLRHKAKEWELSAGKLIHPIRLAVSGVMGGPSLFELLEALGKDKVVSRIRRVAQSIREDSI